MHNILYISRTFFHDNLSRDNYEAMHNITLPQNIQPYNITAIDSLTKQLPLLITANYYPENNIPRHKATMQKGQIPRHSLPKNFLQ